MHLRFLNFIFEVRLRYPVLYCSIEHRCQILHTSQILCISKNYRTVHQYESRKFLGKDRRVNNFAITCMQELCFSFQEGCIINSMALMILN